MQMFIYLILAAVIYGILAERLDRAAEREIRRRRSNRPDLRLVEEGLMTNRDPPGTTGAVNRRRA